MTRWISWCTTCIEKRCFSIHDYCLSNNKNKVFIIKKGRWNLDYDKYIQDRKVYLTNIDNCGCCENIENNIEDITNDELYPYFF